jgi:RimJ/RimL family protein N-acetyltransferase
MLGPVLRGDKIYLRPRTAEEAITYVRHFENLEVTKLLGSPKIVPTLEQEVSYLEESSVDNDSIHWAVYYEGNCVGSVSIEDIDWMHRRCEIGLFIGESRLWGNGLGYDAVRTALGHVFNEYPFDVVIAMYFEGNTGSMKLQRKLGFQKAGKLRNGRFIDGSFRDLVINELTRETWQKINE